MTANHSLFKKLPERRAFQEIVEQISNLIYSKKLNPGDRLPSERELSIQFGTGRMAVREAFRVLEQTGLVYIKQGTLGGAYIKGVDVSIVSDSMCNLIRRASIRLEDFIAVRNGIDRLIIESVIHNVTEELIEKLEKNVEATRAVMKIGDSEKQPHFVTESARFHIELARATNNQLFDIIEESLLKAMRAFMREGSYDYAFDDRHLAIHEALCQSLRHRDLSRALQCINDHSQNLFKYLSDAPE